MDLKCILAAVVGGSIMYYLLHGPCAKDWLKKKKKEIDKKIKG